jgi:hypothetical protein
MRQTVQKLCEFQFSCIVRATTGHQSVLLAQERWGKALLPMDLNRHWDILADEWDCVVNGVVLRITSIDFCLRYSCVCPTPPVRQQGHCSDLTEMRQVHLAAVVRLSQC